MRLRMNWACLLAGLRMSAEWLYCQTEKDVSEDELGLSAGGAEDVS